MSKYGNYVYIKLSVFLPFCDTETVKNHLNEVTAGDYYQGSLLLSNILDPDFLTNVIRSGKIFYYYQ